MPKSKSKKKEIALIAVSVLLGCVVLAAGLYFALVSLFVSAPQLNVVYNAADDFPQGMDTMFINGAGRRGKTYYVVAEDAEGTEYTFRLAEDFTAQAFEPGADGALYQTDYDSPQEFYTQWYRLAARRDALGTAFAFDFEGDEIVLLMDTAEPSPPDGP